MTMTAVGQRIGTGSHGVLLALCCVPVSVHYLDQLWSTPDSDFADSLRAFGTGSLPGSSLCTCQRPLLGQAVEHT